ncbi:MAG: hypothetical protein ACOWWR_11005, partial [Eubacteriales bacterium]
AGHNCRIEGETGFFRRPYLDFYGSVEKLEQYNWNMLTEEERYDLSNMPTSPEDHKKAYTYSAILNLFTLWKDSDECWLML